MNDGLVKIIMPVYNSEKTIEKSIQGILDQTFTNWQLFVVDDGSTDHTAAILNKYRTDPRKITMIFQCNRGVSAARNTALDETDGDGYIAYCDADDIWEPNHLENSLKGLEDADLVYSNPKIINEEGNSLSANFNLYNEFNINNLKEGNFIYISTVVHRGKIGKFDSTLDSIEDYDLWIRAIKNGYRFKQLDEATCTYLVKTEGMAKKGVNVLPDLLAKHEEFFYKKLHLGCGTEYLPGYTNVDLYAEKVDERWDVSKVPYPDNSIDEILASHIVEHFHFKKGFEVLGEWCRVLKPGGKLIIETPDFLNTCKRFVEETEQGRINLYGHFWAWPWCEGQRHEFLYTETQLKWTLETVGFKHIKRIKPFSIYYRSGVDEILFLAVEAYK